LEGTPAPATTIHSSKQRKYGVEANLEMCVIIKAAAFFIYFCFPLLSSSLWCLLKTFRIAVCTVQPSAYFLTLPLFDYCVFKNFADIAEFPHQRSAPLLVKGCNTAEKCITIH
jgi:hypothetical protein